MKRKEITALHGKSLGELQKELKNKYAELSKMTLERQVKQEKNNRKAQSIRDDIARIQTVIKEQAKKGAVK